MNTQDQAWEVSLASDHRPGVSLLASEEAGSPTTPRNDNEPLRVGDRGGYKGPSIMPAKHR